MLYPKNDSPRLEKELFERPTCEYRGTPFWAWNCKLTNDRLDEQIDNFKKMGMGGFHMHVRTGMDSPYLDDEFMGYISHCIEKAREKDMLAWLYDEDRWPSGTAGGKVTADNPEYAMKLLLITATPYDETHPMQYGSVPGYGQHAIRFENGKLLAVFDVELNDNGTLKSYRRIGKNDNACGVKWYAYAEHCTDDPWFNDHPYVDAIKKEAVEKFIETTHKAYADRFGNEFGKTIPAIFTDEPHIAEKAPLAFAKGTRDVFLPWTDDLESTYTEKYGDSFMDRLPELIWELPQEQVSPTRYRFHDHVAERFASVYCGLIGRYCQSQGIALTGHVLEEPTLLSQTNAVGEAMRCYPPFGIPGIDMLCDFHEYNTAKQTQSVVHQEGKEGMLSELYGVTGWDYEFRGYKLQGDWQAALGVTVRVPHLTWMTMKGEAKRDYPACIGYQSPWWKEFSMVEDHFARLNTALTRGKPVSRVAVIHPIESYWLACGPYEQTEEKRSQLEHQFAALTEYLLFGQIDFDFISEALLPKQCSEGAAPLPIGQMRYDAVIVNASTTLRSTTLERLEKFRDAGGMLIFVGKCPALADAVPSERPKALFERSVCVDFDRTAILNALEPLRFLDIRTGDGKRVDTLLYNLRQDHENRWLFIANGKNPVSPDVEDAPVYRFTIRGEYTLTEYNTLTGNIKPLPAEYVDGNTVFNRTWYMHDSLLLMLTEGRGTVAAKTEKAKTAAPKQIMKPVSVMLDEPNMYLLDMAEYAMDGGEYQPLEEILRLDNKARAALGIPLRRKEITQPYLIAPETCTHTLKLRFTIPCEFAVCEPMLALEDNDRTRLWLNGAQVSNETIGWYVDKDIHTVKLPELKVGTNILEVEVPIGRRTNLEAMYLLGDFGVRVNGTEKTITAPVCTLGFGDVVPQGLPFYTGCIDYAFDTEACTSLTVRTPQFRGGLIKVFVDGNEVGAIAFSPYTVTASDLENKPHHVTLKFYGTRQNGFAQLHHTQGVYFYQSPNSWRSENDLWCYEYQFKPMGILKSPEITISNK